MLFWIRKTINILSPVNLSPANCAEILLQYQGKQLIFRTEDKTITRKIRTAPPYGRSVHPESYFQTSTVTLPGPEFSRCGKLIHQHLNQLPLSTERDILPPGASFDSLLIFTDKKGRKYYYTNTHLNDTGFSIKRDPVSNAFLSMFSLLDGYCRPKQDSVADRYFEETIWVCRKCSAANLMSHQYCVKCGTHRGW